MKCQTIDEGLGELKVKYMSGEMNVFEYDDTASYLLHLDWTKTSISALTFDNSTVVNESEHYI